METSPVDGAGAWKEVVAILVEVDEAGFSECGKIMAETKMMKWWKFRDEVESICE